MPRPHAAASGKCEAAKALSVLLVDAMQCQAITHLCRWITKGMPPKSNLGDRRTSTMLPPLGPITWQNEAPDF